MISLDPADGKLFWRFPLQGRLFESSATPSVVGDMLLASAITYGSVGLQLTTKDGKPAVSEAWKEPKLTSYFSTPVAVGAGARLHGDAGSNFAEPGRPSEADLHCVEATTGKTLWTRPKVGQVPRLAAANRRRQAADARGRRRPGADRPEPEGVPRAGPREGLRRDLAHPALAGGKLYLRDEKEVMCVQLAE